MESFDVEKTSSFIGKKEQRNNGGLYARRKVEGNAKNS